MVHLPVHASWLNQVEIYFSVIQRKVLTPNDFADLAAVQARLLAFQDHYQQIAAPFEWKFTKADLRPARTHRGSRHRSSHDGGMTPCEYVTAIACQAT